VFHEQILDKSPHSSCENNRLKSRAKNFLTFYVFSTQGACPKKTDLTSQTNEHKDNLGKNHGSQLMQSSFTNVSSYESCSIF